MIRWPCVSCGQLLEAPDPYAGRSAGCPACKERQRVPAGTAPAPESHNPSWHGIRLFVSSTFRDMQAERQELAAHTFPKLRKLCAERGLVWREVDLRWGITEEEARGNRAIPVCLAEVDRCRPYFIGLLGERYGWVPDEIPPALLDREPWLAKHRGASVTELEILYGVFHSYRPAGATPNAFFYLRDPRYAAELPPAQRNEHLELPTADEIARYGAAEAERLAAERRRRLVVLKEQICTSGLPVRENYPNPRALADMVLRDLTAVIDAIAPPGRTRDPLDAETSYHDAFAATRCEAFVGRTDLLRRLDDHTSSGGRVPLVVGGDAGSGKSALLAHWARRRLDARGGDVVVTHFVGASPYTGDSASMLRRLMALLKRRLKLTAALAAESATPAAVRDAFVPFLQTAAAKARVVVVIDGLDRLPDAALNLPWLVQLPPGACAIVSAGSGDELKMLREKACPVLWLPALTVEERALFVRSYLGQYGKSLTPELVQRIAGSPQSATPRFLALLLDEVRATASHERLGATIDNYLSATDVQGLYAHVLRRCERDYGADRPGLVGDALRLLWAARGGLSERELLDLLGTPAPRSQTPTPLPQAYWSGLYLALRPVLLDDHGLLRFADAAFASAVQRAYLPTPAAMREAHVAIAAFFAKALAAGSAGGAGTGDPARLRALAELPWQLAAAGEWAQLRDLLTRDDVLPTLWLTAPAQVRAWWVQIAEHIGTFPYEAYAKLIRSPAEHSDAAWAVATLLDETGRHDDAAAIRRSLTGAATSRVLKDQDDTSDLDLGLDLDGDLGLTLNPDDSAALDLGDSFELKLDDAISLDPDDSAALDLGDSFELKLDDAISLEPGDDDKEIDWLADSGALDLTSPEPPPAKSGAAKPVSPPRQVSTPAPPAISAPRDEAAGRRGRAMVNEAISHGSRHDYAGAIALYRQAEPLLRSGADDEGLQACLGNLGAMLLLTNDFAGADAAFTQQEAVCRACGNRAGLAQVTANRAYALQSRGDRTGARAAYADAERLARENGDAEGTANALVNRSAVTDDAGAAESLLREAEQIYRRQGMLHRLGNCLAHRGKLLVKAGDLKSAAGVLREAVEVCSRTQDVHGQASAARNLGLVLTNTGELASALEQYRMAEGLSRKLNDREGLVTTLLGESEVLLKQQAFDAALAACREAESTARTINDLDQLRRAMTMAMTIQNERGGRGAPSPAASGTAAPASGSAVNKPLFMVGNVLIDASSPQQAMAIAGARHHLAAADKAAGRGDLDAALAEMEHALRVGREAQDAKLLAEVEARKAELLGRRGRRGDAVAAAQQAVAIARGAGDPKTLIASLAVAAQAASSAGRHDEALAFLKEQQATCDRSGDAAGSASSAAAQVEAMLAAGNLGGAQKLCGELSAAAMAASDQERAYSLMLLMSRISQAAGQVEPALQMAQIAVSGYRKLSNRGGLARALFRVGVLQLFDMKQPAQAAGTLKEAEESARAAKLDLVLTGVLGARAEICFQNQKYAEAAALVDEQIAICRRLPGRQGLAVALNRRVDAALLQDGLRSKVLDALMREAEAVSRATGDLPPLLTSLGRQLSVAKGRSDHAAAADIVDRGERAAREAGNDAAVAEFLRERAKLVRPASGGGSSAAEALAEAESIARRTGDALGAAIALAEQAAVQQQAGRLQEALRMYAEAAKAFRAHGRRQELAACQAAEASIRLHLGETDVPARLLADAEPVFRELNDRQNLANCLTNKLDIMEHRQASPAEMVAVLKELHAICRQTGDRHGLAVHLARYADLKMRTPQGINAIVTGGDTPAAIRELSDIFDSFGESEKILRELRNFDAAARVMITRANALSVMEGRGSEALTTAQAALRLANDNGLVDLARELMPLLDAIRSRVG